MNLKNCLEQTSNIVYKRDKGRWRPKVLDGGLKKKSENVRYIL